ncbi:MAG TPA: PAS domain-containing protein [Stellaceae bacterium]|nr:PAS domain-containing protein [Stellaceae bacterium]
MLMTLADMDLPIRASDIAHPQLARLFQYWDDRRLDRPMPSRADIDPIDLKSILPHLFLVDVTHDPLRLQYRLVGTELTDRLGCELRGKYVDEMPDEFRKYAAADYEAVIALGKPQYTDATAFLPRYKRLMLPLSADGKTVNMILGGVFRV